MKTRRVKANKFRLLTAGAMLLSLTACDISFDGVDFSGFFNDLFLDFPAPAPVASNATIAYYDMSTSPFADSARFSTAGSDRGSMMGSNQMADIAANIASLAGDSEDLTVRLEGHADMRCTESTWQRENGPNPKNGGKWCSPRAANGVTPQGRKISQERAETVRSVLEELLLGYPGVSGKVSYDPVGLGEAGALGTAEECRDTPNSSNCKHDRRVDVYVSSRTCIGCGDGIYSYPGHYPTPDYPTPDYPTPEVIVTAPPTCLELRNCPADPKPVADPAGFTSSGFAFAQQNADQLIKFKLGALTCNNGQPAPCGVPSSGQMRTGVAGPYLVSAQVSSFNLNAPAGYAERRDYRIPINPTGSPIGTGVSAKLRFYAATRTAAPYTYSATAAVTIEWHNWQWDGSTMTVTSKTTEQLPTTSLVCAPVKTPACSFGVLGSNVN
jgi:hypothetical protein